MPITFTQNLVNLDRSTRTATVLGEINKGYVVTPDIDRLLDELVLNNGVVPGEDMARVKKEAIDLDE